MIRCPLYMREVHAMIERVMKLSQMLFCAAIAASFAAAEVPGVQAVYVMPMANRLDQFLASKLTEEKALTIVADPKRADAVLTDKLGEAFEQQLDRIYPVEGATAAKESGLESEIERPVRLFQSGSARGNVFLVDVKTRQVIWSTYERPKNTTADQMHKTAGKIVDQFQKDFPTAVVSK